MAEQKFRKQRRDYRNLTQADLIRKENDRKRAQDRRNRRKLKEFAQ